MYILKPCQEHCLIEKKIIQIGFNEMWQTDSIPGNGRANTTAETLVCPLILCGWFADWLQGLDRTMILFLDDS